jgi:hypothetical protein
MSRVAVSPLPRVIVISKQLRDKTVSIAIDGESKVGAEIDVPIARRSALGFAIDRALQALRVPGQSCAGDSARALLRAAASRARNRFDEVQDLVTRDRERVIAAMHQASS